MHIRERLHEFWQDYTAQPSETRQQIIVVKFAHMYDDSLNSNEYESIL